MSSPVNVDRLMREIETDVRRVRRTRLLAHGGSAEYNDPAIYESVDAVLQRAIAACEREALLLPALLDSDDDLTIARPLQLSSHRAVIGSVLVFIKRRLILPLTQFLYDHTQENFRRQQQINRVLFACIEELAIENARLKQGQAGQVGQVGE